MNRTFPYYLWDHLAVALAVILTVSACAGERSIAPQVGASLIAGAPGVAAQTIGVGDEVILWTAWSIPQGSDVTLVITGRGELDSTHFCSAVTYYYDATIQYQKSESGNTHFPGAAKFQSTELLQPGTKLRLSRWVTGCDGYYEAYAFEVISVPGNNR